MVYAPEKAGNVLGKKLLAIGAGSLMFSHVNDSGFLMAKEYFNLSIKETIMSWTFMESIAGIVGVLILEAVLY